jgi:hypothetical protein
VIEEDAKKYIMARCSEMQFTNRRSEIKLIRRCNVNTSGVKTTVYEDELLQ